MTMPPRLRIVYRSTGLENDKPRPAYYSKTLALASVLRAAEQLTDRPEIVFLNDGEIPRDRLAIMEAHGKVRAVRGGSNRATFRAAVAREAALSAGSDHIVWFAEDDYLYRPDSLTTLVAATVAFPDADYFALYGSDALDKTSPRGRPVRRTAPGAELDPDARTVGAATWFRAYSTTSTFAVRSPILLQDARLLRLLPYSGGAWDMATCLTYQGYRPFRPSDLLPSGGMPAWRGIARALIRAAINLRGMRRPSRRRVLLAADPELIWHMEVDDGTTRFPWSRRTAQTDWASLAADTMFWAADRGMPVPASQRVNDNLK